MKNTECQEKFHKVTSVSQKLENCLIKGDNFEEQSNQFFKHLDDILHQCFRKIRVGKRPNNQEINSLLAQKTKSKISLQEEQNPDRRKEIEEKINQIEKALMNISSERNLKIVQNHIRMLGNLEDKLNQNGMWKLKNKLWPKERDPPMAKLDEKGYLISCPEGLKKLYLRHYENRLYHRQIKNYYEEKLNN